MKARHLALALSEIPGIRIDMEAVQTNMVFIDLADSTFDAARAVDALRSRDVLVIATAPRRLRAVTHLDVSMEQILHAIRIFQTVFKNA